MPKPPNFYLHFVQIEGCRTSVLCTSGKFQLSFHYVLNRLPHLLLHLSLAVLDKKLPCLEVEMDFNVHHRASASVCVLSDRYLGVRAEKTKSFTVHFCN